MSDSTFKNDDIVLEVKGLKQHFTTGFGTTKNVVKAVDGIDFTIHKGQTFGLVGESGCGKTTTGRSVIRLYTPTAGEVYYNGELISGKITKAQRLRITQGIQMIFQDPISSLNPRMTIKEIVGEGLLINKLVKSDEELTRRVLEIISIVGLSEDHLNRYPHEFSGGQRQRVGIARVLVSNPGLVIADEPVSALDVSIRAQVLNLLSHLQETMGLTVLFISHDLSVVKYFCDYIAVMYAGKIVESGTPRALFSAPCHPYTRALLSAIPIPDPDYERDREYISFDTSAYRHESDMKMHKLEEDHFVYATDEQLKEYLEV